MDRFTTLMPGNSAEKPPIGAPADVALARKVARSCYLAAMTLVILFAFAVGASGLNADIVWLDEMFSLANMGAINPPYSPQDVVGSLRDYSPDHVPLYFALGSQWGRLVGWSQLPMRYLSLLFGALLIAAVFRFAAEALGKRAGLLAAFLLSANGFVILYFHEIRMYTLLLLLAVVHSWLYWRIAKSDRASGRSWILFITTGVAVIYTHVFSLYFFAGLLAQHLVFVPKTRRWLAIIAGWLVVLLAFLPYITIFSTGFFGVTTSVNTISSALTTPVLAVSAARALVNDIIALWLPIAILVARALWTKPRGAFPRLLFIFAVMLLCVFAVNAAFRVISINRMRYFLLATPFFAIVTAYLLLSFRRWRVLVLLFLLVWAAGGYRIHRLAEQWHLAGHHTLLMDHPPLQAFVDALQGAVRPHDFIIGFADSPMINWPLKHGWTTADYYAQTALGIDGAFVNARLRGDELREHIEEELDDYPYLLFTYDPRDKHEIFDDVVAAIQARYRRCAVVVDEDDVFVQRYVDDSLSCEREYQPIHYDNGIKIVDKFGDYDRERQTVRVVTGWEVAHEAQLDEYNISFQIVTPDWKNVAQARDQHLYNDILKWHAVEMSTAELPPGNYRVVVIVYEREKSSNKVTGVDLSSGEVGVILPILHFTIAAPTEASPSKS